MWAVGFSGGLDSTVLAYDTVESEGAASVVLIHVDAGMNSSKEARKNMQHHASILGVRSKVAKVGLPSSIKKGRIFSKEYDTRHRAVDGVNQLSHDRNAKALQEEYAPGLYTIMWSVLGAAAIEERCDKVCLGFHSDKNSIDCLETPMMDTSKDFVEYMNTFRHAIWGPNAPSFVSPLCGWSKADLVRIGIHHNIDFSYTNSCDVTPPCGTCYECRLREEAFEQCLTK